MKKIYSRMMLSVIAALMVVVGCKKDDEMKHTNVSPVGSLYAPNDNASMNLGAASTAVFEWEGAKAEDNGVVLYDVIFDKEDGDFSNPIYRVPADGKGFQRTLTLSFADLNKVAGMAGIKADESGKLKWTVWSSKGLNVQKSTAVRTIVVKRPAGFSAPDELFLAGSAAEGGDDLSKAVKFKRIDPNSFEIYTSLKNGELYLSTSNISNSSTYYIEGGKLKEAGKGQIEGNNKVYRIRVNFAVATTEIAEIETVGLWFAPENKFFFEIPYAGNGTWEIKNTPIVFRQESWGRDERYKFRFKVKNTEGVSSDEWYGSTNRDNQRPTSTTAASYWNMVPVSSDRWDNSFKFSGDADNKNVDVKVIFNSSVPAYTHSVTVK